MKHVVILALGLLLFFSGCVIGTDSQSLARELAEMRKNVVPNGLLVPPNATARQNYENALLTFRKKVPSTDGTLNAYLNGSVDLLDMQRETDDATSLLQGIDPSFIECGPNTSAGNAITHYETAQTHARDAKREFETVRTNAELSNTLGADYVVNVINTTDAVATAHAERVNELKAACGQL